MAKTKKRGVGRPPVDDPLRIQLTFKVTPEEAELLQAAAKADNRAFSSWIRRVALAAAAESREQKTVAERTVL